MNKWHNASHANIDSFDIFHCHGHQRRRKQQEEAKAIRALEETLKREKEEGVGESGAEEEEDGDGDERQNVDYSKPQVRKGYHLHLMTKDDDKSFGHKTVDKGVASFAERALYGRNSGRRISTNKALAMKRKGRGASVGFATSQGNVKRLRQVGGRW